MAGSRFVCRPFFPRANLNYCQRPRYTVMKSESWGEAVLPVIIVVYLISYLVQTYDLPFQTILYPFLLVGLLVALLLIFALQQMLAARKSVSPEVIKPSLGKTPSDHVSRGLKIIYNQRRAFGVVILTFLFPHVVAHLGFFFTASLYLSLLFTLFRTVRPILIIFLAPSISAVLTWVLLGVVQLNFPRFEYVELPWYF